MYSFEQIAGNKPVKDSLQKLIELDHMPHAVVFSGAKGIGKKLLAKTLAKTLQCEARGLTPCNKCNMCSKFESNNQMDIIFVSASKTKSIGVDDIREQITKNLYIKPFESPYKIFIINSADTMTIQAQNAILKTLEEPPSYAIFLLLSENDGAFLPTVLSRCVLYKLKPLPSALVTEFLIKFGIEPEKAGLLSIFSQGNIGRALSLAEDDEFIRMRQFVLGVTGNIFDLDLIKLFALAKESEAYKERINEALDMFYLWYRDLLVAKQAPASFLLQPDIITEIRAASAKYSLKSILSILDACQNAKYQLKRYGNFQLVMEVLLMKIKECS